MTARAIGVRRALLFVVVAAAFTAAVAGLARLGVRVGAASAHALDHGPLFVLGVFGTVIALERAVAFGGAAALLVPISAAATAVAMIARMTWAPWCAVISSTALVLLNGAIARRQPASFTVLMALGSFVLLCGDIAWAMGSPIFRCVPAWIGFFVLTIVAERLELSRLAMLPAYASRMLVVLAVAFAVSSVASVSSFEHARHVFGATMSALALWQLRYDLARRTVKQTGLARFSAIGVLVGAAWLACAGALFTAARIPPAGPLYDAVLHCVFVGYVLSMVFAHAPIILPAVARVDIPFTPLLYVPAATLHLGLLVRVIGDLAGHAATRQFGGMANVAALLLFALAIFASRLASKTSG